MVRPMQDFDVVALLHDLPQEGLIAGQTGTIVLTHANGEAFEVEFPLAGRKYVVTTVRAEHLLKLHNPARAPAAA